MKMKLLILFYNVIEKTKIGQWTIITNPEIECWSHNNKFANFHRSVSTYWKYGL